MNKSQTWKLQLMDPQPPQPVLEVPDPNQSTMRIVRVPAGFKHVDHLTWIPPELFPMTVAEQVWHGDFLCETSDCMVRTGMKNATHATIESGAAGTIIRCVKLDPAWT